MRSGSGRTASTNRSETEAASRCGSCSVMRSARRPLIHKADRPCTIDHALTRPWTVMKSYKRENNPIWNEYDCSENNNHVRIGTEQRFEVPLLGEGPHRVALHPLVRLLA